MFGYLHYPIFIFSTEADLDVAVDEAGDELRELLIGSWNLDPAIYDILIGK